MARHRTTPKSDEKVRKYGLQCRPTPMPHGISERAPAWAFARSVLDIDMLIALMVSPTILLGLTIYFSLIYTLG